MFDENRPETEENIPEAQQETVQAELQPDEQQRIPMPQPVQEVQREEPEPQSVQAQQEIPMPQHRPAPTGAWSEEWAWERQQTPPPPPRAEQPVPAEPLPEKQKKKKRSGVGKLIAVAALCAVLGAAGGAAVVGVVMHNNEKQTAEKMELLQAPEAQTPAPAPVEQEQPAPAPQPAPEAPAEAPEPAPEAPAAVEFVPTTISVDRNDGTVQLTPAEIYRMYVDAVVIITQEGTTTNVFGQISPTASSGSGFILTKDGYILTNYHVVKGAMKLTVTTYDEKEYEATVVGYDADNDVALVKIEAEDLPVVAVGDSEKLSVGDQVVAIGNPLGELTNTLTVGYISSTEREINESSSSAPINMLQTDAAINGGNSGGPLFDMAGNVIGITTAKYTGSQIEGLGFAIPINDAMAIVEDLLAYGYVKGKPYMGIVPQNMSATTAQAYNLPMGVYVRSVEEGTPAEKAGLVSGDIITNIDDYKVESYNDLVAALRHFKAGDTAVFRVFHSGAYREYRLTFAEKPRQTEEEEQTQTQLPSYPYGYGGYYGG